MNDSEKQLTVVKPRNTWDILTIRDLWEYRDMLLYLVLRDIKARYTQSVLGIGWAVLQPLFLMIVFTVMFTALAIQYRDVRHGISFLVQGMMYASPVVYPVSIIPDKYRLIYGLNPMAGVIEGFRSALLGATPMPWDLIIVGTIVTLVLAVI